MANYFLARDPLKQVKLHKLLYYSHGWHFCHETLGWADGIRLWPWRASLATAL